jgi:hypothetical protein
MTNEEFLTLILSRIGKRQTQEYLQGIAVTEIQVFIQQKEMTMDELPFFLETADTRTMTAGQWFMDLPSDFLKEIEETGMIGTDTDTGETFPIIKRIPDVVNAHIAACAPGKPKYYGIFGNRWIFGPVPNKAYQFSVPYGRKSALYLRNTQQTTDWILHAPQAVSNTIQEILAAQHLQAPEMAATYRPLAAQAWAQFNDYCNARKYSNVHVSSGDEE